MDQYAFAKDSNVFSASVESLRARGIPLIVENIKKEYMSRIGDVEVEPVVSEETVPEAAVAEDAPKKRSRKK